MSIHQGAAAEYWCQDSALSSGNDALLQPDLEIIMKHSIAALGILIATGLAAPAIAQSKGEADPEQGKAAQTKRATKEEKAAAKTERRTEGRTAARTHASGDDSPSAMGTRKGATPQQRKEARAERKTEGAATARTLPLADDTPSSAGARKSPSKTQ